MSLSLHLSKRLFYLFIVIFFLLFFLPVSHLFLLLFLFFRPYTSIPFLCAVCHVSKLQMLLCSCVFSYTKSFYMFYFSYISLSFNFILLIFFTLLPSLPPYILTFLLSFLFYSFFLYSLPFATLFSIFFLYSLSFATLFSILPSDHISYNSVFCLSSSLSLPLSLSSFIHVAIFPTFFSVIYFALVVPLFQNFFFLL